MLGSRRRPNGVLTTRRLPTAPQHRPARPPALLGTSLLILVCFGVVLVRHFTYFERQHEAEPAEASAGEGSQLRELRQEHAHADAAARAASERRLNEGTGRGSGSGGGEAEALAGALDMEQHFSARSGASGDSISVDAIPAHPPAQLPAHPPAQLPAQQPAAPQLSEAELHGGWNLTWEIFDRATKHPNATVVSWRNPRVLLIRDFLSPLEVEHLIQAAEGGFERSTVVSDEAELNSARTSSGSWLNGERRDDMVREVQRRIHDLIGIPEPFGESLYVLRYGKEQRYDVHTDHCAQVTGQPGTNSCREFLGRARGPQCGAGGGGVTCGDRLATFILYLKSPQRGGPTVFPSATSFINPQGPAAATGADASAVRRSLVDGQPGSQGQAGQAGAGSAAVAGDGGSGGGTPQVYVPEYCQEGADTLQVSPPPGSAVLFWDYVPAGDAYRPGELAAPDPTSQHGGCPVLAGEKMIATRWIRAAEFH